MKHTKVTRVQDNIQSLLSIGYLSAVLLGIVFTRAKYSHFGINIFSYSDALDFLIAPFKDIQIIIYALIPTALILVFFQFDKKLRAKFPRAYSLMYFGMDKRSWFKQLFIFQWVLTFFVYIVLGSAFYGNKFKEKFDERSKTVSIEFQDNRFIKGKLIGSNPNFLFLQDTTETTIVVPINSSVKAIRKQS